MMRFLLLTVMLGLVTSLAGCGNDNKVILPTNKADIKGESKAE